MPEDPPKPDPPADPPKPPDPPADTGDEVEKWKAMARKHEAEAKKNSDAAKKLQELEDANKSESQKLTDRATEAEKRAEAADARALKLEIAGEKGLTPKQAARLVGTTRAELEADADELLESFGGASKGDGKAGNDKPGGRPKAKLKPGSVDNTDAPVERDPRKLAEQITGR